MEKRIYIRVPEQLLKDFDATCEANYTTKSEVLRRAMLDYVRQNQGGNEMEAKMTYAEMVDEARKESFTKCQFNA